MDGIAERSAVACPGDLHDVPIFQRYSRPEAEGVRAEEVKMDVARATVRGIFEVVVLQVREGMHHVVFPGGDGV